MAETLVAKVGEAAPEFALACADARDQNRRVVRSSDYAGRWAILIFYPRDFSFVCPTELTSFSARGPDFRQRGCDLLGISVDSVELHWEWLRTPPAEGGLGPLQFPLASDPDGATACAYGVWVDQKQVSTRGLFIIDPAGTLQYAVVHNLNVGRSPDEVLRVLDALQTGGLCPASWTAADGTIDAERALQPGRILGHYRIRQKLGGGTFGNVFAAWDLRLERTVALKVLKCNVFESREAALAEARAAAKVNHPCVCTVYAVEEEDGLPLIAMEFLDGRTLAQMIAKGLSCDTARNLAAQIASGLAAAHAQHVVHGDLKPANVIVSGQGTAKILDFGLAGPPPAAKTAGVEALPDHRPADTTAGLAKASEPGETLDYDGASSDEEGGIRGTPAYMSPEQAAGLRPTPASDVFAFGLTLFEMLTGRMAFPDPSLAAILTRLQTQELGPRLTPQVEEPYRNLLAAMLARDAARRPAISEVLNRLTAEDSFAV
jgi:alkyl hydroperoxide reductase subunit AhpC/predicted Ser/Thr protein kinase